MFILKDKTQIESAIAKALITRPLVEFDRFGRYCVSGSKDYYTIVCRKGEHAYKAVECTCGGAEKGLVYYHAVSDLSFHIALARQQQADKRQRVRQDGNLPKSLISKRT